jgi:hypothetical protein
MKTHDNSAQAQDALVVEQGDDQRTMHGEIGARRSSLYSGDKGTKGTSSKEKEYAKANRSGV